MSVYYRLKRRLGYDPTTTLETSRELYEYEVEHTNGETSTVVANGKKHTDGFVLFSSVSDANVVPSTGYKIWLDYTVVRELGSVVEVSKIKSVGCVECVAVVDCADGSVVEKSVEVSTE